MATAERNWKRATICGWLGCVVGAIAVCTKIVSCYVLYSVGRTPATMEFAIRILDADVLAFIVGIPLGVFAWRLGRKDLGIVVLALCVGSLIFTNF